MRNLMLKLLTDETGILNAGELVLIMTLSFTAVTVGLGAARDALTQELNDISEMIGTLDQSYNISGLGSGDGSNHGHGNGNAMGFNDRQDLCDCVPLTEIEVPGKVQYGSDVSEAGGPPTNL